ncbi:hypothetical protein MC7420_6436 [Coleofasciculus chthonoplastes PCC 7420]|uniref:Uncharacterized protein n=1 Tax=Coleofasciculus chthonoplastes PCC 7420 TaxID=118168 RepID=B4VQB7_9CYAN|nr:hypothetical protein MC7420_6436 [Coleofasciculus chthonoplastes PCC 7420]
MDEQRQSQNLRIITGIEFGQQGHFEYLRRTSYCSQKSQ